VDKDIETLVTALYVKIHDEYGGIKCFGRPPKLSASELLCLAVAQALLSQHSEARWIRYATKHMTAMFPYLPTRSAYNRRLRSALPLVKRIIRDLARDSDFWFDNHWIVDSTPVPCAMSRPSVKRSNLAGWASYGYCASHTRYFWGLRLYLVCTPTGMPIMWALANAKMGEREVLAAMLEVDTELIASRDGILLISDKGFASADFERFLAQQGITLLRPSRKKERERYGQPMLKKVRQLIESVNDTLKGQLDLEFHGGRTCEGVAIRIAQRVMALAAAIWFNNKTGAPVTRSLIAFDH
jgi:hypothetical protein